MCLHSIRNCKHRSIYPTEGCGGGGGGGDGGDMVSMALPDNNNNNKNDQAIDQIL